MEVCMRIIRAVHKIDQNAVNRKLLNAKYFMNGKFACMCHLHKASHLNMENEHPESHRYFSQTEKDGLYKTDAVYLSSGSPGTEVLRMLPPLIEAATSHRMHKELEGDAQLFQYGVEEGNWQFRSFLATFLSEKYGDHVESDCLFLTNGASTGLWLLMSRFFTSGTLVFVDDPSYMYALGLFQDLKMNVVPVKSDEDGMVMEDLEEKLKSHLDKKPDDSNLPFSAVIYVVPIFHNPTGALLPDSRCRRLVALAHEYGTTVVCDDVYNLLHYDNLPNAPRRLLSYDKHYNPNSVGHVISNGSFSKFLAPGLRIGWIEAPRWTIASLTQFGVVKSGGGLNTYTSGIVTSMLALGKVETHLQKVRTIYKTQMEAVAELLGEELPPGCSLKSPAKGGFFLWVELPETIDASHLLPFCKKVYQVTFTPGKKFSPTGSFSNCMRICISFYPLDILLAAVRRLCQAIEAFTTKASEDPMFWKEYEE